MAISLIKQINSFSQKTTNVLSNTVSNIKHKISKKNLISLEKDVFIKNNTSVALSKPQNVSAKLSLVREPKFNELTNMIISSGGRHHSSVGKTNCELFEKIFGKKLYSPTKTGLNAFKYGIDKFVKKEVSIPEGIDGILIGHGKGSFLEKTWKFEETQQNVMEYINSVLPAGKKMLVFTCETAENATQHTPGIGNHVITSMDDAKYPVKIVEAGKGIIGHFLNNQATYY